MTAQLTPSLSVVVPVYNSEQSLPELIRQLAQVLPAVSADYEVILVNDGSRDRSGSVITELAAGYPWVRGIHLMRNYGQHNALLCGIRAARGAVIVTLDDDLQHPPQEIPALLAELERGYDVVYGAPQKLAHSPARNFLSKSIKATFARLAGVDSIRAASAFRAFRTDLRIAFANYQSPDLILDGLLAWGTTRFTTIYVRHEPRRVGRSNYNFYRLFRQTMLLITGFSTGPLRLASFTGFLFTLFGLVVLAYVLLRFLQGGSLPGFTFLAAMLALFSGGQLFTLGLFGEYLIRMYNRSIDRPTYVVRPQTGEPPTL